MISGVIEMNEQHSKRIVQLKEKTEYLKQKHELLAEQNEYKIKSKAPSTSKLILWAVVLICIEIVIFSEYAMIKTGDTSALYALIGVPATLIPTVLGYYHKAAKENCKDGLVYMAKQAELNCVAEAPVVYEGQAENMGEGETI